MITSSRSDVAGSLEEAIAFHELPHQDHQDRRLQNLQCRDQPRPTEPLVHVNGDIFAVSAFTQGGGVSTISVY